MIGSVIRAALLVAATLVVVYALAIAQERKPGENVVYDMHMTGHGGPMGAGRDTNMSIALGIDRVDPDGSAHAKASMQLPQMPQSSAMSFEATILPTGAIIPKYDPNLRPHAGMSVQEGMAMSVNGLAQMMQTQLRDFNTFANTCAQRTLRVGDSWNATMEGPPPVDIRYTVTGRQPQLGHDAFVVNLESAANARGSMSGQGYYDSSTHLVVGLHTELKSSASQENGTTDIALHP